jgi:hypothetical protein
MIVWTPIAVSEKPQLRGKGILPEYAATVIGSNVVLKVHGGPAGVAVALTAIAFPTPADAVRWVEANKIQPSGDGQLGPVAFRLARIREQAAAAGPAQLNLLPGVRHNRLSLRSFIHLMRERKAQLNLQPRRVVRQRDAGAMQAGNGRN